MLAMSIVLVQVPFVRVTVTDEQGLSASTSKSYRAIRRRRRRRGDPLIFDLNQDGKINLTGGKIARNATSIPVGLWDVAGSMPKDHRYVISDANSSNGTHESATSVNSSGRWKIGIESQDGNGQWNPLDISAKFDGDNGILTAGGVTLNLVRTSDGGYQDDGMGFTSVGGAMVEFDMHPDNSLGQNALTPIVQVWALRQLKVVKPNTIQVRKIPLVRHGKKTTPKVQKPKSMQPTESGLASGSAVPSLNTSMVPAKTLSAPNGSLVMVTDSWCGTTTETALLMIPLN